MVGQKSTREIAKRLVEVSGRKKQLLKMAKRYWQGRNWLELRLENRRFRNYCKKQDWRKASEKVTAVVLTVDPSHLFDPCIQSLEKQRLKPARVEIVRNVMPFSKASQEALDLARTEYYAPVDDDMVLSPSCLARLFWILETNPQCAEALAFLHDPIFSKACCVRMYRTAVIREIGFFPLKGEKGCERKMFQELEQAGYYSIRSQAAEGDHHPLYLPHEAFWRFRFMAEQSKYYESFHPPFREQLERAIAYWRKTGGKTAIYALAGLFSGLRSSDVQGELTYEGRLNHPDYLMVKEFLETLDL